MAIWEALPALAEQRTARQSTKSALRAAVVVLAGVWLVVQAADCRAAGYAVGQESVSGMGVAYAGGAAAAGDVSTVFYNPAGMTRIRGDQVMFGGAGIFPLVDYDEQGSLLFNGQPYGGGEGGDGGQDVLVPHFYGVWSEDYGIKLGLSVNSPWGLITNYEDGWKGRYSEITTSLKSFNANPAIAFSPLPGLSVGLGASVQYLRGKLTQAIDFGSNCAAALGAATCQTNFGIAPGLSDGFGKVRASAIGYGANIGLLYEPFPGTRFGAHYRSRMNFHMTGKAKFNVPAGARAFLVAAGLPDAFTAGDARLVLVEPEMASVSAYHDVTDRLAIMGDITWTRWGVFEKLIVKTDNTTPDNLLETHWDNVFRYSLGVAYKWSPLLTLRGGVAFDDSPIKNDFRGPGIPDSDRIVLGLGFGYAYADNIWVDVGYQHLFFKTGNTRRISATNSTLNGDFNVDVDVIGLGVTWKW